jgi:hypothetical protein
LAQVGRAGLVYGFILCYSVDSISKMFVDKKHFFPDKLKSTIINIKNLIIQDYL